jgi:hypothetical protein
MTTQSLNITQFHNLQCSYIIFSYKFKAREFDPKIVEKQGTYGLKPLPPKTLTEVKPFALASEQRSEIYKQKEKESQLEVINLLCVMFCIIFVGCQIYVFGAVLVYHKQDCAKFEVTSADG